jgi:hypothetical protein
MPNNTTEEKCILYFYYLLFEILLQQFTAHSSYLKYGAQIISKVVINARCNKAQVGSLHARA